MGKGGLSAILNVLRLYSIRTLSISYSDGLTEDGRINRESFRKKHNVLQTGHTLAPL